MVKLVWDKMCRKFLDTICPYFLRPGTLFVPSFLRKILYFLYTLEKKNLGRFAPIGVRNVVLPMPFVLIRNYFFSNLLLRNQRRCHFWPFVKPKKFRRFPP